MEKYLVDTCVLIQAHKTYYSQDICPGFWDALVHGMDVGVICSICSVYDELTDNKQDDAVAIWAKKHKEFFMEYAVPELQDCIGEICSLEYVKGFRHPMVDAFLRIADPWLIAYAKRFDYTLVTQESPKGKDTKIKIPPICEKLEVPCIDTFQMLQELKITFGYEGHSLLPSKPVQRTLFDADEV